jgi:hypothetical protein
MSRHCLCLDHKCTQFYLPEERSPARTQAEASYVTLVNKLNANPTGIYPVSFFSTFGLQKPVAGACAAP